MMRTDQDATVINGECVEKMREFTENSIDAIVTDPPYGISFMGSAWDNFSGKSCGKDTAEERLSKAIEYQNKHRGAPRYGNGHGGAPTCDSGVRFYEAMMPVFQEALRVAKPGAYLLAFGGSRTYHRLACAIEDAGWEIRDCIMWVYGSGFPKSMDVAKAIDKENAVEAQALPSCVDKWSGWGTALKPAYEPIIVARKPLDGTVANTILTHGTGAINIDGCRIPLEEDDYLQNGIINDGGKIDTQNVGWGFKRMSREPGIGRWPANVVHDGSQMVLDLFPGEKGQSAARFFYCAKASRKERGEGNNHPTVKPISLMRYLVRLVTPKGSIVLDPFCGSGSTGVAAIMEGARFIGIEREPQYSKIAMERIKGV